METEQYTHAQPVSHRKTGRKVKTQKSMKMRGQLAKIVGTQLRTKLIALTAMLKNKSGKPN